MRSALGGEPVFLYENKLFIDYVCPPNLDGNSNDFGNGIMHAEVRCDANNCDSKEVIDTKEEQIRSKVLGKLLVCGAERPRAICDKVKRNRYPIRNSGRKNNMKTGDVVQEGEQSEVEGECGAADNRIPYERVAIQSQCEAFCLCHPFFHVSVFLSGCGVSTRRSRSFLSPGRALPFGPR